MKIILYIGHHKVGSTALQVFFAQNWLRLIRAGILYPSVESTGFANNLARALSDDDADIPMPFNVREPHSALAYRMMSEVSPRKVPQQFTNLPASGQMFHALRAQIKQLNPKAMVLSSEAFSNFGDVQPNLIKRLRRAFPKAELEIYCALRRPDDYLVSWHGQRMKVAEKIKPLHNGGTAPYFDTIHFDFRKVVQAWVQHMPDARLVLRNYADILAAGGSIEDFIAQCGTDFPTDLVSPGRANASLPRAAMELVRRANHDLPADQARPLCHYLLEQGDRLNPVKNADVEMFGADLRADLATRFAPVHDYLSELTGSPFFPGIDQLPTPRPIPEAQANAELLARIDPDELPHPALRDYIDKLKHEIAV